MQAAKYIIRLDDIAPHMNWDRYIRLMSLLDTYQVSPIIGVIPDNQNLELNSFPACPFDFLEAYS